MDDSDHGSSVQSCKYPAKSCNNGMILVILKIRGAMHLCWICETEWMFERKFPWHWLEQHFSDCQPCVFLLFRRFFTNILPGLIWYSLWGHWVRRKFLKGLLRKLLQVSSSGWWKFRNNFTRSSSDSRKGSNDSIVSYFRPRCQPAIVFNQTSLADLASIPNPNVRANRCSFNDTMLANLNVATNHQGNSKVLMHRWW